MGAAKHDGLTVPGRVVLAHEPAFTLGILHIDPALRQVRCGEASETLEPRVMQVLVALAKARGAIVTRDELIHWCWEGRIVGDDSINRALSRIRRLAEGLGGGSFSVETITRVGYRLKVDGDLLSAEQKNEAHETRPAIRFSRRNIVATIAATSLTAALGTGMTIYATGRRAPVPPEARQLYDRATALSSTATPSAYSMDIPLLQEAVRIAPEFGEAWGALALAYRGEIERAPERRPEYEPRLAEAVAKARRFDPGNADADAAMLLPANNFGKWVELEHAYRGLVARHPDYALGHHVLGELLMDVGRWSDAVDVLRTARRLQPLSPIASYKLIVTLWGAGRISEAEDEIEASMRRWPRHGAIWQTRIKLLALSGRPQAALALLEDAAGRPLDDQGDFIEGMGLVATALLTGTPHDVSAAAALIARNGPSVPGAIYCSALGRIPLALDMLEQMYLNIGPWELPEPPIPNTTHPLFQPHARPLWPEPRFNKLLGTIGLERYWRSTRTIPDYRRR